MTPEELYNTLDEICELEETFKGDPEASKNESSIRHYRHLLASMPDLISYAELREYHAHLRGEAKKELAEAREELVRGIRGEFEEEKGELEAELEGLKRESVGEFKRKLLEALKARTSSEAYAVLESEIEGLGP